MPQNVDFSKEVPTKAVGKLKEVAGKVKNFFVVPQQKLPARPRPTNREKNYVQKVPLREYTRLGC